MTRTHLPKMGADSIDHVVSTLTRPRLSKYLQASRDDVRQALRLYVFNAKVSGALMIDLHYIEVALRNKFDDELAAKFGPAWFRSSTFLSLVDGRSQAILLRAQKDAVRHKGKG